NEYGRDLSFEYDRKDPKTHGEASGRANQFVTGALTPQARVFIIDDVATSMGTKYDLINLLHAESIGRKLNLSIVGVGLAVDREQTTAVADGQGGIKEGIKGADSIADFTRNTDVPVHTLVGIRSIIAYLSEQEIPVMINGAKRPLDAETLDAFKAYMAVYGVERG
ncbi:MAG: hypothetical protein HQK55_16455, partial [Deltaproteobacteria bacterium]|nr:hypothetical protein [Deltaproteobacteria bacterium]